MKGLFLNLNVNLHTTSSSTVLLYNCTVLATLHVIHEQVWYFPQRGTLVDCQGLNQEPLGWDTQTPKP